MTYITAEPEQSIVFVDRRGNWHATREQAVDASFNYDFHKACISIIENHPDRQKFQAMPVLHVHDFIRAFVKENPDMTRVLLGDQDAT